MCGSVRCIKCGSDDVYSDYNYDFGKLYYECNECGESFSEDDLSYCDMCDEQVLPDEIKTVDGMVFCSEECMNEYINSK